MHFEEWMQEEKQRLEVLTEEVSGIESKMLAYKIKRLKEKFPDAYIDENGDTAHDEAFKFCRSRFAPECLLIDEDPAEIHLTLDPIYKAMIKEHEALKVNYADRNTLLVHAAEYEDQRAWLEAKVVHKTELDFQAKQIQDKLAGLETSINSHMENYSRRKDAYEQLQAEYNQTLN